MKTNRCGYSLLELMIVVVIIAVMTLIALPYYQNAAQSARATEVIIWWGRLRNMATEKNFTPEEAERTSKRMNEKSKLKYNKGYEKK